MGNKLGGDDRLSEHWVMISACIAYQAPGSCPGVAGDSTDKGVHAGTGTPVSIHVIMLLPMQELKESGELLLSLGISE